MPLPELQLVDRLRRAAKEQGQAIGDDCAVLDVPRGEQLLLTTDFSLEGVHFRREWHPADSVGHRCLARGLSDIAAMGGTPRWAFLSLGLPAKLSQRWADDFLRGLLKLAKEFNVELAGGDTAESPHGVLADIVVAGSVKKGAAIPRSGARPGDFLYVTGHLGASLAVLQELRAGKKPNPKKHLRHFYPDPRVAAGQFLSENKLASAMIDTSDGLSTDLKHICEASGVGAVVDEIVVPSMPQDTTFRNALHGGEDYELLFTVPRQKDHLLPRVGGHVRIAGLLATRIGGIAKEKKIKLWMPDGTTRPFKPEGWEHFR